MIDATIIRAAQQELARRDLFYYCCLTASDFYKEDRIYLQELCQELQLFLNSDEDVLIVNEPPRHGKSRTAGKFVEWLLGNDQSQKIMTASYNETLSTVFSKSVRNTIQALKVEEETLVYSDIFPGVTIKEGDAAMNLWSLTGSHMNYLATSPKGTATGFGASLLIIDDLIKSALEAHNARILDDHWQWFTNTMFSRLESGGKILVMMTRWHSNDLAGVALKLLPEMGFKVKHITMKALQDDGKMLCEAVLSKRDYLRKIQALGPEIAAANYQQEPIDVKGRLYPSLKTYEQIPENSEGKSLFTRIGAYCDTADEGKDYLCAIVYGVYNRECYVLDVVYTKAAMEETELAVAQVCIEHEVNVIHIESNNGGRGFARQIERLLQRFKGNRTIVSWFHQSQNKQARILSQSTWVQRSLYLPTNWQVRFPDFYRDVMGYQKEGKNAHDDAPDALTGVCETFDRNKNSVNKRIDTLKKLGL